MVYSSMFKRYVLSVIGVMCICACYCASTGRIALGGRELCTTMHIILVGGKELAL
jgi:hypothetical protein